MKNKFEKVDYELTDECLKVNMKSVYSELTEARLCAHCKHCKYKSFERVGCTQALATDGYFLNKLAKSDGSVCWKFERRELFKEEL